MGVIANIRGALGLTGPTGLNGVVGLFVVVWSGAFAVAKTSTAITFVSATGTATFVVAGYYLTDWKNPAVFQAAGSTVVLSHANHQIAGPLT